MQKSGLIIWVWTEPFFLVHVQKSRIIIQVWAHPFFIVHMQKFMDIHTGFGSPILRCPCAEIRVNHTGLGSAILPFPYAEIWDNCTGLGSPILPCPYVETRDIHTVFGSPILPCPYAEIRVNLKIANDPKEVSETFNNFFINVAKDIVNENINIDKIHPSIIKIEENKTDDTELSFRLTEEYVNKQISKLNIKKATGYDSISPKILKLAQPSISDPINILVNKSIESSIFPENLKSAQVSPLFNCEITDL